MPGDPERLPASGAGTAELLGPVRAKLPNFRSGPRVASRTQLIRRAGRGTDIVNRAISFHEFIDRHHAGAMPGQWLAASDMPGRTEPSPHPPGR